MALFVIVQSVTINPESWPSIFGEALEDLNLLWKPMEEAWTTPDFPRGSPVFPHVDARTLRIQTWSTVSALGTLQPQRSWKLENDGSRQPNCGGTEFTPHATKTKVEIKSIYHWMIAKWQSGPHFAFPD